MRINTRFPAGLIQPFIVINVLGFRGLAFFKTADKTGNSRINRSPIQKVRTKTGFSLFFWPLQPFVFREFPKIVS